MTIAEAAHVVTNALHEVMHKSGCWKRIEVKGALENLWPNTGMLTLPSLSYSLYFNTYVPMGWPAQT